MKTVKKYKKTCFILITGVSLVLDKIKQKSVSKILLGGENI